MKNDFFADIAASGIQNLQAGLKEQEPQRLKEITLEFSDKDAAFQAAKKMDTKEELYEELERQKQYYEPFLKEMAPPIEELRIKKTLKEFQWRVGTKKDAADLMGVLKGEGNWEQITIPHYGEPRGVAVTYYRTEFYLDAGEIREGSLWAVFQGVDYKAHVFVNGCYLGSHEGFFAPFEFDFTRCAAEGLNSLAVMVENDYIHMGNVSEYNGLRYTGDKFYAATGLGYDEPAEGWHHCPPGMGIYQNAWIEKRSRLFLQDIFVRPLPDVGMAELWLEVYSCDVGFRDVEIRFSVYGQNFEETVFEEKRYLPMTSLEVGRGDTLTEAKVRAEKRYQAGIPMQVERGINYFRIPFEMDHARRWEPDTPWLYQCQVKLVDETGSICDTGKRQFGMRSFRMDEESEPKGKFYLNNRQIRLRGANTMGHEQQCVFHENWDQLLEDMLLAKVCNMNFLRLTQRPVQPQIYDYCDKIGLMIQTDLPMFAALRRNQFVEGIKQVQEMEHLIRAHPCCIIASYINEPMPNAHNKPHRNLERKELEGFFEAADIAIRIINPDRVVKHVDGDYEPPTKGYPDNHCYPCWYNGHGIDIGKLHKGYWMDVKEGWHYGCGEFGIEALEDVEVMQKYYPKAWLPEKGKETDWTPDRISGAQTGAFHYCFYDTQHSLKDWVNASQQYQADAISLMTQAFRRDRRMNSFAYHLFIDAFPSGWMKTIMDVDRNPKKGFFAYRDALTPLMVNLRSDRRRVYEGEEIPVEVWICNDHDEEIQGAMLHYQILHHGNVIAAGKRKACISACTSEFQGFVPFKAPKVQERDVYSIQAGLFGADGQLFHEHSLDMEVFPQIEKKPLKVCILGEKNARVEAAMGDMGWTEITLREAGKGDLILVLSYDCYKEQEEICLEKAEKGAKLLFQELQAGDYEIGSSMIHIRDCGMLPLHFVSRGTNHPLVRDFLPEDLKYWYDPEAGYITPLLERTIEASDFEEIVSSGNQDSSGNWHRVGALMKMRPQMKKGQIYVNEIKLFGRTGTNPTAAMLLSRIAEEQEYFGEE